MVLVLLGGRSITLGTAADSAPRIPKLPPGSTGSSGAVIDEPARALPETTTVCWDPAASRCWTVAGENVCSAPDAPAARPFRVVIGAPSGPDATRALVDCRAQPEQ